MKQVPIKLGPLALLLTVISICLTTLAILNFTTARADMRLAEKYAETVAVRYALEAEGQELLARMAGDGLEALPGAETDEGTVRIELERDGARLRIALVDNGEMGYDVVEWKQTRDWSQDTSLGNLWPGN